MKNKEIKEKKTTPEKKKTDTTKKQETKTDTKKKITSKATTPKKEEQPKKVVKEEVIVKEIIEDKDTKKKNSKSKKKIKISDIILILGLVIVVVLGCFLMKGEKVEPGYELPLVLSGEPGLQQLTYQEYQEKIDNNESFVVIIERATCSHCISYMPIAESFAKDNNVPMYYVDTDTFTDEDWKGFEESNTYFKKNSGNWGTPTTLVLAGNEEVANIVGETTADELKELYNEYFEMTEE